VDVKRPSVSFAEWFSQACFQHSFNETKPCCEIKGATQKKGPCITHRVGLCWACGSR